MAAGGSRRGQGDAGAAVTAVLAIMLGGLAALASPAAAEGRLRLPGNGVIRSFAIGIDDYRFVAPLRGARADAQDVAETMRREGAIDVTVLLDAAADRRSILEGLEMLASRTGRDDLVIVSIAGHGAQEPEQIKGSQPDGLDDVFVLPGFDPGRVERSGERILGREFRLALRRIEERGATVIFVADACHGGGLTREVDPRGEALTYRSLGRFSLSADDLKPVGAVTVPLTPDGELRATYVLAAADRHSKAPEVRLPGSGAIRGALSYALARGLEGAADADRDGVITARELFSYVRQLSYQLSEQRQSVVTEAPRERDIAATVLVRREGAAPTAATAPPAPPPIRLALRQGSVADLPPLASLPVPVTLAEAGAAADLVFDAATGDLIAGGDLLAERAGAKALPGAVARLAAASLVKGVSQRAPQSIEIVRGDRRYRGGERVEVAVRGVRRRALLLVNLPADGSVQVLYPRAGDEPVRGTDVFTLALAAAPPFGSDLLVAVTAPERQADWATIADKYAGPGAALAFARDLATSTVPGLRVGAAGLFTGP